MTMKVARRLQYRQRRFKKNGESDKKIRIKIKIKKMVLVAVMFTSDLWRDGVAVTTGKSMQVVSEAIVKDQR